MRLIIALCALVVLTACGGTVVDVEVRHYPNATAQPERSGFYTDREKWERVRERMGTQIYLSRGEFLSAGSGANNSAAVMRRRLIEDTGYRGWVCRQAVRHGVIVVGCARHHKLQRYVRRNNQPAFRFVLLNYLEYGNAAPAYIDWGW